MFGHHKDKNKPTSKEPYKPLTATPAPTPTPTPAPILMTQPPVPPTPKISIADQCFLAAKAGDLIYLKQYVNANNVNTMTKDRASLLHVAVDFEKHEVVRYLLDLKANVNDDVAGRTPLHIAAEKDNIECMQMLIAAGADINAQEDRSMDTPLMGALKCRQETAVSFLISHNANVNIRDKNGSTPVSILIKPATGSREVDKKTIRMLKLLLDKNADIEYKVFHQPSSGGLIKVDDLAYYYYRFDVVEALCTARMKRSTAPLNNKIEELQAVVKDMAKKIQDMERQLQSLSQPKGNISPRFGNPFV